MELRIALDSTNFPMMYIESGKFHIHWMPVTKIQFEYFLSSGSVTSFGSAWYEQVLDYNERVTPGLVTANNYWQSFITGITPMEIKAFAGWLGKEYDIPTHDEWQIAYKYLKAETEDAGHIGRLVDTPGINRRASTLIKNIAASLKDVRFEVRGGRTLADQALMRLGIMEYVYRDDRRNTYGGYGQPNSSFFGSASTPDKGLPERLVDEHNGAKMMHYGVRLIKRDAS